MKSCLLAFSPFLLLLLPASARASFAIASGGVPRVVLSVPEAPTPSEAYAVAELKKYLDAIAGASFTLATNAPANTPAIRVGGPCDATRPEEIRLRVRDENTLELSGEGTRGAPYAVYALLERLGCGFWAPGNETVPSRADLAVPADLDVSDAPAFLYRQPYGEAAIYNPDWNVKVGLNGDMWARALDDAHGGRFQMDMAQSMLELGGYGRQATNFTLHPEWFALRGGKCVPDQLCAQDPGCRAEILRRAREVMAREPDRRFLSVSLGDNDGICQCEKCAKLVADEGISALALEPANFVARALARDYPKLNVITLAYWITEKPPKTMRCEPNVAVCFARPPSQTPGHDANLGKWCELSGSNVWIWGYNARFHSFPTPYPCIDTMGPEFRRYREQGVKGVFAQLPQGTIGDFESLRCWLFAKLLWDPGADQQDLVRRWCEGACGKGAPKVLEWLREMTRIRESLDYLGAYGQDTRPYLKPDDLFLGKALLDEAERATRGDRRTNDQVRKIRASVLIALLNRYHLDIAAAAREKGVALPSRGDLYAEVAALGREFRNGCFGEQYDWGGFLARIRHGETILQGVGSTWEKPWTFQNPVSRPADPDPFAVFDPAAGLYCRPVARGRRVEVLRGRRLPELFSEGGETNLAWSAADAPDLRGEVRAPELVRGADGKWRIYASCGDGDEGAIFALESETAAGRYVFKGLLATNEAAADPTVATLPDGRVYLVYTAGGRDSDASALRALELPHGADPCDAQSWKPLGKPLLVSGCAIPGRGGRNAIKGPRCAAFLRSPDGAEDWVLFQGRAGGSQNPGVELATCLQRLESDASGAPETSATAELDVQLIRPAGESVGKKPGM